MNFGRLLLVSSSHLLKRTIAAPASVENSHLWKRSCTTIAGPALASVDASVAAPSAAAGVKADLLGPSDGSSDSAQKKEEEKKEAAKAQRKMFEEQVENLRG